MTTTLHNYGQVVHQLMNDLAIATLRVGHSIGVSGHSKFSLMYSNETNELQIVSFKTNKIDNPKFSFFIIVSSLIGILFLTLVILYTKVKAKK